VNNKTLSFRERISPQQLLFAPQKLAQTAD
jgi:hypothetical protein